MRVIVLGSGVIGTSAAYYLAEAGHQVVVVDRREGPALETSFANAGQVSPGYSSPWAAPGIPLKALKWLFMRHRPLFIWPTPDPDKVRFGLMMLRNCTSARYELNKSRMVPLAEHSRDLLRDLRERLDLAYDERAKGLLQLFRHRKQLDGTGKDVAILDRFGIPYELLDVEGCVRAEPALGLVKGKIAGGLRLLGDETGDCFKFTNALAALCRQLGVEFRYGTRIDGIATGDGRVTGIATDAGTLTGDAYVVALGSRSPLLLRRVGIDLPVYPVKGYSITVPITDPAGAPEATIMDEAHKVAITRLGDRIRNRPGPLRVRQHFSNTVSPLAQIEMSPSPLSPWRAPAAADPHSSARRHATSHVRALVPGLANDNASNTKRVGVAGAPQGSSCSP